MRNLNEIFWKDVLLIILKVTKKPPGLDLFPRGYVFEKTIGGGGGSN